MEYLDGVTLEDLVKAFGPHARGRIVRYSANLRLLAEAHAAG